MSDPIDLERYGVTELSARRSAKWLGKSEGHIAAWIADMDFPIAEPIRNMLQEMLDHDDLGYPDDGTAARVRSAFSHRMANRYGVALDPENMVVTADVVQAIAIALLTLTQEGDGVCFFTPAYPPFFGVIKSTHRRLVECELAVGPDGYHIDFAALRSCIERERPRCLLLCNPHNPTGRAFSEDELRSLGELACEFDLLVLSDEIHADLVLDGAVHYSIAGISNEIAARCVTLSSASKAFNIAGLRCAVAAFGSSHLFDAFTSLSPLARGGLSTVGMHAALTAWESCDPWLEAVTAYLSANRTVVDNALHGVPGVQFFPPQATYLAWIDLAGCELGSDPMAIIREHAGITLSPGWSFGDHGAQHVRLNFATPRPVLTEMLQRITAVATHQH